MVSRQPYRSSWWDRADSTQIEFDRKNKNADAPSGLFGAELWPDDLDAVAPAQRVPFLRGRLGRKKPAGVDKEFLHGAGRLISDHQNAVAADIDESVRHL